MPVGLEVGQEGGDGVGIEVVPVQMRRCLARAGVHELKQQLEGVAVGGDGAGAGLSLLDEPPGEEAWKPLSTTSADAITGIPT